MEMKMPSSVGSQGFPAWPLAPPRMLMPSFSPGAFWIQSSRMPGGGGSLLTSKTSSRQGRSRALTASWCVASRMSCPFTARMRSPTRRPLRAARPRGSTCREGDAERAGGLAAPRPDWALLARERLWGRIYLGDEDARLLDTKRVAGVIGAPDDAESQGAPGSRQADLLRVPRGLAGMNPLEQQGGPLQLRGHTGPGGRSQLIRDGGGLGRCPCPITAHEHAKAAWGRSNLRNRAPEQRAREHLLHYQRRWMRHTELHGG